MNHTYAAIAWQLDSSDRSASAFSFMTGPTSILAHRFQWTPPAISTHYSVLTRVVQSDAGWFSLFKPFETKLWLVTLASVALFGLFLSFITKGAGRSEVDPNERLCTIRPYVRGLYYSLTAVMGDPQELVPISGALLPASSPTIVVQACHTPHSLAQSLSHASRAPSQSLTQTHRRCSGTLSAARPGVFYDDFHRHVHS